MKSHRIYIVILVMFLFLGSQAQTIRGYVLTQADRKPVEFASILVLKLPDSSMVKGVVTYLDGQYNTDIIKAGTYFIKASMMGFESRGIAVTVLEGNKSVLADTIFLAEKVDTIESVIVKGEYVRAKEMVDRTVYEILPEVEKTSINGYDVLKKIPSVQVDFNNNVTLDGKSNFIIQVDGKQRDKEFLARILPGDIESVEIIHNPSGKYEGSIEGVINVTLKQEARTGVNGNFGIQYKPVGKTTLGAMGSLDYGLKKISFYVSGFSFIQNLDNKTIDYRNQHMLQGQNMIDSILDMKGKGDFGISASSINTGFDYYLNDKNNISFNYSYKPFSMENSIDNEGDISKYTEQINFLKQGTNMQSKSDESNVSLFYRKKFKKPIQELTVESNYYWYTSDDSNSFYNILYAIDKQTIESSWANSQLTNQKRKYISTKIDYVQPVGVIMRLEAGYQLYYQLMNYNFNSNLINLNTNFDYNEFRNSAYISYFLNLKNISFQTTIRIENSQIEVDSISKSDYTTVLPSANILYKINSKQNVKFTYNRRINRPDIYNLNPFTRTNNDQSESSGNPKLKPEYKDRLQLTYNLNYKKINFAPYIYHEFYNNKIENIITLRQSSEPGKQIQHSSPENILTGYEQGIGLNATLWTFNINGSIYQGHYKEYNDTYTHIEAKDYMSYRFTSYVYASVLKQKLNLFAFINYEGVNISAQSKTYSPLVYGLGSQYNYKNHSAGIFYILPFTKELVYSKTITETAFVYSENISKFNTTNFFQVMYSYKFNKGRTIKKSERKVEVESDTKGGGLGR